MGPPIELTEVGPHVFLLPHQPAEGWRGSEARPPTSVLLPDRIKPRGADLCVVFKGSLPPHRAGWGALAWHEPDARKDNAKDGGVWSTVYGAGTVN
ncbi:hypothetical protein AAFF_G00413840 [Aldrovandia affinis]|uniref:Uncharacterized protein n=1 Tax=Aldrovandia affinis TaxID=143900 RepID=A0AAD7SB35_9TELE|nr:hypothetical protein AAFF_G00413840 [Aldrovandia affinis]